MSNKEFQLYLALLDKYLNNNNRIFDYKILSAVAFDNGVCFTFKEFSPWYQADEPTILILKITVHNELLVLDSNGNDCIYGYLEENGMTKDEADMEAAFYKQIIVQFKRNGRF